MCTCVCLRERERERERESDARMCYYFIRNRITNTSSVRHPSHQRFFAKEKESLDFKESPPYNIHIFYSYITTPEIACSPYKLKVPTICLRPTFFLSCGCYWTRSLTCYEHRMLPLPIFTSESNHSIISFKFLIPREVGYNDGLF